MHAIQVQVDLLVDLPAYLRSVGKDGPGSLPFAGSLVESRLLGSSPAKTQQRPSSKDSK